MPLVVGLRDYSSDSELGLCFSAGDHLLLINTDGEEEWLGYHVETGKTGYLQRTFVREKLERKRYILLHPWHFHVKNMGGNGLLFFHNQYTLLQQTHECAFYTQQ